MAFSTDQEGIPDEMIRYLLGSLSIRDRICEWPIHDTRHLENPHKITRVNLTNLAIQVTV